MARNSNCLIFQPIKSRIFVLAIKTHSEWLKENGAKFKFDQLKRVIVLIESLTWYKVMLERAQMRPQGHDLVSHL